MPSPMAAQRGTMGGTTVMRPPSSRPNGRASRFSSQLLVEGELRQRGADDPAGRGVIQALFSETAGGLVGRVPDLTLDVQFPKSESRWFQRAWHRLEQQLPGFLTPRPHFAARQC